MNTYTNKALGLFVVLALGLAALPTVQAAEAFGDIVSADDGDNTFELVAAPGPALFCYTDDDGSGTFNPTEPVYFAAACATVATNDIRIANPVTGTKGSQVGGSSTDRTNPLTALGGIAYFDSDGDGAFGPADTMYVDSDASGTVTIGDDLLAGSNAGTAVTGSASNNALIAATLTPAFLDADGDGVYSAGDWVFLDDPNAGGLSVSLFASVSGILLTGSARGSIIKASDRENTYELIAAPGPALFCYTDDDGSGTFNPTEPVYFAAACATGATNDIRIANPVTGTKGSQVGGSSTDRTNPLTALGGIAYFDSDGDGAFGPADTMYVDSDASGTVTIGDVILAGSNAGTAVTGSASNNALIAATLTPAFHDVDGDGVYSAGDTDRKSVV